VTNKALIKYLSKTGACEVGTDWVGRRNLDEAWQQCHMPNWMLWFLAKSVSRRELVRMAMTCVRPHIDINGPEIKPLMLHTFQLLEGWADGTIIVPPTVLMDTAAVVAFSHNLACGPYQRCITGICSSLASAAASDCAYSACAYACSAVSAVSVFLDITTDTVADARFEIAHVKMCDSIRAAYPTCPIPANQ